MDRGVWWATVHEHHKESDMTEGSEQASTHAQKYVFIKIYVLYATKILYMHINVLQKSAYVYMYWWDSQVTQW